MTANTMSKRLSSFALLVAIFMITKVIIPMPIPVGIDMVNGMVSTVTKLGTLCVMSVNFSSQTFLAINKPTNRRADDVA